MIVPIKKSACQGSVFLIEILIALALMTTCAATIAHYCWHITCAQHEIRQSIAMLTKIHNDLDACIAHKSLVRLTEQENRTLPTITLKNITPRIDSDIPQIRALTVDSFYLIQLAAEWSRMSGQPRKVVITSAGVIHRGSAEV